MRKSIIAGSGSMDESSPSSSWLDLEQVASVEISSEDPLYPLEQALRPDTADGWRASTPGQQRIRFVFDNFLKIRRVRLEFLEKDVDRSQEFALFATSRTSGRRELVRQQWVFSNGGSALEIEDYRFDLDDVTSLELEIDPGRHDEQVFATLRSIRVG